jgi:hypothetical protein
VTYNEYVTELTFLLFLKMMAETGREDSLPNGYRWSQLTKRTGLEQLDYYKRLLLDLGTKGKERVAAIFVDARTMLRKPTNLKALRTRSTSSIGFRRAKRGWAIFMKGFSRRTPPRRNPVPGSILPRARSSIASCASCSRSPAKLSRPPPPAPADSLSLPIISSRN